MMGWLALIVIVVVASMFLYFYTRPNAKESRLERVSIYVREDGSLDVSIDGVYMHNIPFKRTAPSKSIEDFLISYYGLYFVDFSNSPKPAIVNRHNVTRLFKLRKNLHVRIEIRFAENEDVDGYHPLG